MGKKKVRSLSCAGNGRFPLTRVVPQVTLTVNSTGLVVREDNKTKKPVATYPIKKIQHRVVRSLLCSVLLIRSCLLC